MVGQQVKETLTFLDEDISRFMDEAIARRGQRISIPATTPGYYEKALRVLGKYMGEQKPRDVFFLEQDGNFVVRLLKSTQAGGRHVLFEFTKDDVESMIAEGPARRQRDAAAGSGSKSR